MTGLTERHQQFLSHHNEICSSSPSPSFQLLLFSPFSISHKKRFKSETFLVFVTHSYSCRINEEAYRCWLQAKSTLLYSPTKSCSRLSFIQTNCSANTELHQISKLLHSFLQLSSFAFCFFPHLRFPPPPPSLPKKEKFDVNNKNNFFKTIYFLVQKLVIIIDETTGRQIFILLVWPTRELHL